MTKMHFNQRASKECVILIFSFLQFQAIVNCVFPLSVSSLIYGKEIGKKKEKEKFTNPCFFLIYISVTDTWARFVSDDRAFPRLSCLAVLLPE